MKVTRENIDAMKIIDFSIRCVVLAHYLRENYQYNHLL